MNLTTEQITKQTTTYWR